MIMFPTTRRLVDFRALPDGGPPPSAMFYGGAPIFGGLVVSSGAAVAAAPSFGDASWLDLQSIPCEAWAILGGLDDGTYAGVHILDDTRTDGYLFWWLESGGDVYFVLSDASDLSTVWSSLNEFPTLTVGGGIGLRAESYNTLSLWASVTGSEWSKLTTVTGLNLPNPAAIGCGVFAVVG